MDLSNHHSRWHLMLPESLLPELHRPETTDPAEISVERRGKNNLSTRAGGSGMPKMNAGWQLTPEEEGR